MLLLPTSPQAFTAALLTSLTYMFAPTRPAGEYVQNDPAVFAAAVDDYSSSHRFVTYASLDIYATFSRKGDDPETKTRREELTKHASLSATATIPQQATPDQDDIEEYDNDGHSTKVPISTNRRRTVEADPSKRLTSTPHALYDPPNMVKLQHTIDDFKQGGVT